MKETFKPIWVILLFSAGVLAIAGASNYFKATPIIPWRPNFQAARDEAARDGKPVFAYFGASWCPPCQDMKSTTWADEQVEAALRAYVPVEIDVDVFPDLAQRYNVRSMPTFIVVGPDGAPARRTSGGMRPTEFLDWLAGKGDASAK